MNVMLLTTRLSEVAGEEARIREISKLGVRMSVVVPGGRWRGSSTQVKKLTPTDYELSVRNCLFTGIDSVRVRSHLYYYPGISGDLRREPWALVHVDDEAYNFATYQVVTKCLKHGTRVIFRTQKNAMMRYPVPFNFFEKYVHRNASGAIAGNMEALNILRRKGFSKPAACIQDGVDTATFCKRDAKELRWKIGLNDAFLIGFVGQIVHRKGIDTLLKALALLPNECVLVLVGAGPDAPSFRSLAQELGVSARVRWEPWVDHREIVKYMCAFDVLVLPSRTTWSWREDFGRVLIEAMACETPVVGSDSGEIPKVIGDAGLIFHEKEVDELASCLRRLKDNPSMRETLGGRGRERVLARFTWLRIASETVEFYRRICQGKQ